MTKNERLKACLEGETVDRPPYSMWMHFHLKDRNPFTLAEGTASLLEDYDVDLLKITPSGLYFVQDFGAAIKFGKEEHEHPLMLDNLLKTKEDLDNIEMLDIDTGAISRELSMIKLLLERINGEVPVLMTVFTPLTIIRKMIGNGDAAATLKYFIETCPESLHNALIKICNMEMAFVERALELGIDGFFFATQAANYETLSSPEEYKEFGTTYDLKIANKIHDAGKLCMMHVCMRKVMLELFKDYPVDIINWDNIYSEISITKAREMLPNKVLAGGIDIFKINDYTTQEVDEMVQRALDEAGNESFILAPTCVLLASTPKKNLREVGNYIKSKASSGDN